MDERDFCRVLDQARPSADQKQAMLSRLLEPERKVKPMKKLKKLTVVGIAAALMVISCAAAVVTGIDQRILDYFGVEPEQETLMYPGAVPVEKSHTYENGWTVDVLQALSDRYSMAVLIDVTAPEGTKLNGEESYLQIELSRKINSARGFGLHYVKDEAMAVNQASYLFRMDYDGHEVEDILGSTWELFPKSFLCVEQDGSSHEIAFDGWSCTVSLSEQDSGVLCQIGQPFFIGEHEMTLDQVYISPISCKFRLKDMDSVMWHNEFGLEVEDWKGLITLHKESGETVEMDSMTMGGMTNPDPDDPKAMYGHYQFYPEQIIDPAEIDTVTIYGQTYELK